MFASEWEDKCRSRLKLSLNVFGHLWHLKDEEVEEEKKGWDKEGLIIEEDEGGLVIEEDEEGAIKSNSKLLICFSIFLRSSFVVTWRKWILTLW